MFANIHFSFGCVRPVVGWYQRLEIERRQVKVSPKRSQRMTTQESKKKNDKNFFLCDYNVLLGVTREQLWGWKTPRHRTGDSSKKKSLENYLHDIQRRWLDVLFYSVVIQSLLFLISQQWNATEQTLENISNKQRRRRRKKSWKV